MNRPAFLLAALAAALTFIACAGPDRSIEAAADRRAPDSALLLERLSSGAVDERLRAARAIGRIQSPSYVDGLAAALADEERPVRVAALFALGQLGLFRDRPLDPRAAAAVLTLLRDPDAATVAAALEALGKLGGIETAPEIAAFLAHAEPAVRSAAAFALFRLRFAPLWRGETEDPPVLPDAAVEALTAAMSDLETGVRFAATYAFSRYGDSRAREALLEAATDPDATIRLFAVRGLGHVADATVVPRLIERLDDDHAGVRVEAVGALDRAGAYDVLERYAGDPSFHVRAAQAAALGHADSPDSLERLLVLEQDDTVTVRVAAIGALLERGESGRVESWATSPDWRIRAAAARATGGVAAFADADPRVQAAALEGAPATPEGDAIVTEAVAHADLAIRGTAVPLVAARAHLDRLTLLTRAYHDSLGDDWIEVRESIVDALDGIDGGEALLREIATQDDAASVRGKAAAALGDEPLPAPALPAGALSRWIERPAPGGVGVDLETIHGTMRIEVLVDQAPVHAAAFLDRVDAGFYDGLIWHRVVSNFVIQGGDPRGDGWGSAGENLRDEINTVRYGRGAVGMPKAGKDTGGCQLFITHVPTPHLDGNYTIFGQVVAGLEIIDAIEVGDAIQSIRRVGEP